MSLKITRADVWAMDVRNRPGMLARILEALATAGADLEFVVARRVTENTSRVFVAPLKGAKQLRAAADVGLQRAAGMHCVRVSGPDRPGAGARLTRALAAADLNLRGVSNAAIGSKFLCYFAFATADDADTARKVLKRAATAR
ncbi:MAG: ACT domain-containing protein [Planctomycetia bacterium]|nr:MAG: ACT domain-containing protein [Planctomycetia bacterium]